jgi:hypothetical protein
MAAKRGSEGGVVVELGDEGERHAWSIAALDGGDGAEL